MRLSKLLIKSIITIMVVVIMAFAIPKLAIAATCAEQPNNTNCSGKDPQTQGCSGDAFTVTGGTVNIKNSNSHKLGLLEVRYSRKCQSNWSKVTSFIGTQNLWARIGRSDGLNYTEQLSSTNIYTNMVYAPTAEVYGQGWINQNYVSTGYLKF